MARPKRTSDQAEHDYTRIARMYLQGQTQSAIAAELGLSQQQISYDLRIIRKRWLDSSLRDFDAAKAEELAKIDLIESELWEAWNASKGDKEITTHEEGDGPKGPFNKNAVKKEKSYGAIAYLNGVMECVKKRCELLGLNPEKQKQMPVMEAIAILMSEGVASPDQAAVVAEGMASIREKLRGLNGTPSDS